MRRGTGGSLESTGQLKARASLEFVDHNGEWQFGGDSAQPFDHIGCANGTINLQWLGASRVRNHKEDARQARHVVRVHVCQADGSQLAKAPASAFPGYLRSFPAVNQRQI